MMLHRITALKKRQGNWIQCPIPNNFSFINQRNWRPLFQTICSMLRFGTVIPISSYSSITCSCINNHPHHPTSLSTSVVREPYLPLSTFTYMYAYTIVVLWAGHVYTCGIESFHWVNLICVCYWNKIEFF